MEQIDEREIKMQIKSLQIVPNFMDLKILGRCFYFECSAHKVSFLCIIHLISFAVLVQVAVRHYNSKTASVFQQFCKSLKL